MLHFAGWMDEYVDAALRMQAPMRERRRPADDRRSVGPRAARSRLPGAEHRLAARGGSLVRSLAQGRGRTARIAEPALTWFHRDPTPPERFPKRLNGEWRATSRAGRRRRSARAARDLDGGDRPAAAASPTEASDRRRHSTRSPTTDRGRPRRLAVLGRRPPPERARRRISGWRTERGPTYLGEPLDATARHPRRSGRRPPRLGEPAGRAPRRPARLTSRRTASSSRSARRS